MKNTLYSELHHQPFLDSRKVLETQVLFLNLRHFRSGLSFKIHQLQSQSNLLIFGAYLDFCRLQLQQSVLLCRDISPEMKTDTASLHCNQHATISLVLIFLPSDLRHQCSVYFQILKLNLKKNVLENLNWPKTSLC